MIYYMEHMFREDNIPTKVLQIRSFSQYLYKIEREKQIKNHKWLIEGLRSAATKASLQSRIFDGLNVLRLFQVGQFV